MTSAAPRVQFPKKLRFLFDAHRYKVLHGGRGSAKSWSAARALLLLGANRPLRILCTREIQKSLKESVLQLLADQIALMGLAGVYQVLETEIRGTNGTQFLFAGLQSHTVESIKSYEGIDIVWVEEAQRVSKRSWDILTPTIRKAGSEIWVTLNPQLKSDETYVRLILNPPPGAVVCEVNYVDNPWFTDELEAERAHAEASMTTEDYENIWLGKCRAAVEGAIYGQQMALLRKLGRIGDVPVRPELRVNSFWDLGLGSGNSTAIWLHQRFGAADRFIKTFDEDGKGIRYFWEQMEAYRKEHGFRWGVHYLPHDGKSRLQGAEVQSREDILAECAANEYGKIEVVSVPRTTDLDLAIQVTRRKLSDCYIDEKGCAEGIKALDHYQYEWIEASGTWSKNPYHNWASNACDALRQWAQGYDPEGPGAGRIDIPRAVYGRAGY